MKRKLDQKCAITINTIVNEDIVRGVSVRSQIVPFRGAWDRHAVRWISLNWTIPFLWSYPSKTFFLYRVSGCDHLEREIAIGYHWRPGFLLAGWGYIVFSDWKYQSRLTALIAPLWASTSSGYILLLRKHYSLFVRKKTSVESVLLPTFSANITNHDRKYASNNAPSVYLVPFLRLSLALIALNSLPAYP